MVMLVCRSPSSGSHDQHAQDGHPLELRRYNEARTQKPQSFSVDSSGPLDPTDGGRTCDFCRWQQLTAADTWGRAEREHAVSASNLFKYVAPAQGEAMRLWARRASSCSRWRHACVGLFPLVFCPRPAPAHACGALDS